MNALRLMVFALFALAIGACNHTVPLTPQTAAALKGKEVARAQGMRPTFMAQTPGKAMFGLLGVAAMASAGKKIAEDDGLEDPAATIGAELSAELSRRYGARPSTAIIPIVDDDRAVRAAGAPRADLILDVRTTGWGFIYFPDDWTHYRVQYGVRLRLIDPKTARTVAEGTCNSLPDERSEAPTYDELLDNGGQRLKKELQAGARFCAAKLTTEVLQAQ